MSNEMIFWEKSKTNNVKLASIAENLITVFFSVSNLWIKEFYQLGFHWIDLYIVNKKYTKEEMICRFTNFNFPSLIIILKET